MRIEPSLRPARTLARRDRLRCRPTREALESRALLSGTTSAAGVRVDAARPSTGGAAEVYVWNANALEAIRVDKTAPPAAARDLAILQVAVDDAVNSIDRTHTPDHILVSAPAGASARAAADAAAARVLSSLFPAHAATFGRALVASLGTLPADAARDEGALVGRQVADAILSWRSTDGSDAHVTYTPGTAPGLWQPTPPAFAPALLPQWGHVTPFVLSSPSLFRPPGPPPLGSRAFAAALNQVESLGRADSTTRTADQTQIAEFWADGAGTATPPGHWNEIATQVASARGLSLDRAAHLFAALDEALADAGIAVWDAKFTYNFWRPITAIRAAATDGNPATTPDPTWTPLLATPPFPSYVSGHSAFSAAAATVLSSFFGPNFRFATTSDALPGVTRSFRSFNQAAQEAGISRIYGGIHYSFDNRDGQRLGDQVGLMAVRRVLQR
jgi:membrane-associated phospholipid phosphatase